MDNDSKLRLLYIGKMLQETDEAHPLTNADMMQILEEKYGIKTTAIVTMKDVVEVLYNKPYKGQVIIDDAMKQKIDDYYAIYGVEEQC